MFGLVSLLGAIPRHQDVSLDPAGMLINMCKVLEIPEKLAQHAPGFNWEFKIYENPSLARSMLHSEWHFLTLRRVLSLSSLN